VLLFFSDSYNNAVGTTEWNSVLLLSIRNNIIATNPTCYCVKAKYKRLNYFQNRTLTLLHYNNESLAEPWLLKEPRLCITLLMWLPSLRGSPPAVLFTFRHPVEVTKSLARHKINNVKLQSYGLKLYCLSLINSQPLCRVVTR